jgi:uncharacterized glyoxalase superfamily protein PhnB
MSKQRMTISVESRSVTVIRPARAAIEFWCEACGATNFMVTPERAAEICGVTSREIYRRIETGTIHFVETETGVLFVCSSSVRGVSETRA